MTDRRRLEKVITASQSVPRLCVHAVTPDSQTYWMLATMVPDSRGRLKRYRHYVGRLTEAEHQQLLRHIDSRRACLEEPTRALAAVLNTHGREREEMLSGFLRKLRHTARTCTGQTPFYFHGKTLRRRRS